MFFGFPKEVGVLRMPGFSLDTSIGYREIRKKTAHDLCELLLLVKILRNGILLLQWNLWGGF